MKGSCDKEFDPSLMRCQICNEICEARRQNVRKGTMLRECPMGAHWFHHDSKLCNTCKIRPCYLLPRKKQPRRCKRGMLKYDPELCEQCYYRKKELFVGLVCHKGRMDYDYKACKDCYDECELFKYCESIRQCPFKMKKLGEEL